MINVEELAKEAERLRNGEIVSVVQEIDPLILSLELEANNLRNNVLIQHQEEENETEDIEYEDYEEEIEEEEDFGGFYSKNGDFIPFYSEQEKLECLEDNSILLCKDGTYCTYKSCLRGVDCYINPHTERIDIKSQYDSAGFIYNLSLLTSFTYLVDINGKTSTIISNTQILTHPENWVYVEKSNGYVRVSDLERMNWIVEDGIVKVNPKFNKDYLREKLLKKYPYFEQIVQSIFPQGDDYSWDYLVYGVSFCFVLRVKEVTIRNSSNQKHVIKDLFVLLPFNQDFKLTGSMLGTRGEISWYEKDKSYYHSHLPGSGVNDFCLGSGPIRGYISRFNITPSEDELFNVIYNIKIYIAWESIEGRPHRRLAELGKKEIDVSIPFYWNDAGLMKQYVKSDYQIPINLTTVGGVKTLVVNENVLEKQLVDFFLAGSNCLVYKDITHNKYYTVDSINIKDLKLSDKLFTFKGEDVYTTVKSYNDEIKVQDQEFYAHPKITKSIQEQLTKRINDHIIKKETGFDSTKSTVISFD